MPQISSFSRKGFYLSSELAIEEHIMSLSGKKHADVGGRLMSQCSNRVFICGQCGCEFTASYKPDKSARCPICRKNPEIRHRIEVKPRRSRNYVPISLKVKIR